MRNLLLAASLACAPSAFAADHHRHEGGSLPSAAEACSCGSAKSTRSDCSMRNDEGACVVDGAGTGRCEVWHCHPGTEDAHKAPWSPGKAVLLAPLPDERGFIAPGAGDCQTSLPATRWPGKVSPPAIHQIAHCQEWASEFRVHYPIKDKKADCSAPVPTLLTRCTAVLDPAFRLRRKSQDTEQCSCAEWTGTAVPSEPGLNRTVAHQVCTAYLCRPKNTKAP